MDCGGASAAPGGGPGSSHAPARGMVRHRVWGHGSGSPRGWFDSPRRVRRAGAALRVRASSFSPRAATAAKGCRAKRRRGGRGGCRGARGSHREPSSAAGVDPNPPARRAPRSANPDRRGPCVQSPHRQTRLVERVIERDSLSMGTVGESHRLPSSKRATTTAARPCTTRYPRRSSRCWWKRAPADSSRNRSQCESDHFRDEHWSGGKGSERRS